MVRALPEGLRVAGPVGEDQEHRARRHAVAEDRQELLRRPIDPVEVLDHHDLRPPLGRAQDHSAERLEDTAAALAGIERGDRGVGRAEREEVAQVGRRRAHVVADRRDGTLDLRHRDVVGITLVDAHPPLEKIDERVKGGRAAEGEAMPLAPVGVARAPAELVEQARLADSRLADDKHDLAVPGARQGERGLERLELAPAPDERREPAMGPGVEPRPAFARRLDGPRADGLRLAAHRQLTERSGVEVVGDEPVRGLADHDRSRLRGLLQARGDVGRVADRRIVHPEVAADAADDDEPAIEALAHLEGEGALALQLALIVLEGTLDAERGAHGPLRMILVSDRSAEECHDAVTEELVHRAFVPVHLGQHDLERVLHQRVHVLGVEPGRERGEPGDVHEEDSDLLTLTLEGGLGGEDAVGEMLGGVRRRAREVRGSAARERGLPTVRTEPGVDRKLCAARGARGDEARATARAEPRSRRTLLPAPGALHACIMKADPPGMIFPTAAQDLATYGGSDQVSQNVNTAWPSLVYCGRKSEIHPTEVCL